MNGATPYTPVTRCPSCGGKRVRIEASSARWRWVLRCTKCGRDDLDEYVPPVEKRA